MVGSKSGTQFGDTTHTKIFVGGLPWVTQTDTVKDYFERFGEILEAVVIADKITGRSKGYGFVTFKDPDSAVRACQNPCPVIDGRRANCNLAVLGAHKNHPNTPQPQREVEGMKKFRASNRAIAPIPFLDTSAYFLQQNSQYAFPYSAYGYPLYQQDNFAMSYYNVYGGGGQGHQQYPNYALQGSPGLYYYPWYFCPILLQPQRGQSTPTTSHPKLLLQQKPPATT